MQVNRLLTDLANSSSCDAHESICLNPSSEPSKSMIWSSVPSATVTVPAAVHDPCNPLMSVNAACRAYPKCSTGPPALRSAAMVLSVRCEQRSSGGAPVASVAAM